MILPFAGTVILSFYARHILFYVGYHLLLIALTWVLSQTVSLFGPITAGVLTASLIIQMSIFFSRRLHHRDSQNFLKLSPVLAVIFFVIWIFSNGMECVCCPACWQPPPRSIFWQRCLAYT